jgi:Fe(3+) dicitrate transport protein
MPRSILPATLPAAVAFALFTAPTFASNGIVIDQEPDKLPAVEARGSVLPADLDSPPALEDGKLTIGKKATQVPMDEQPVVVNQQFRQTLARTPGLLVSDQPSPGFFNVNYRGLGDPHESEFILFAVNGFPVLADWFGYPTLYHTPPHQQIERVNFIRGGGSLLFGPQPGPVVDLVLRGPELDRPTHSRIDLLGGSDGFFSAYLESGGGDAERAWFLSANQSQSDGQRINSGFEMQGLRGALLWQPAEGQRWTFDASGFRSASREPGRLTGAQFASNPMQSTATTNVIWIDRVDVSLGHQRALGDDGELNVRLFHWYQDRYSRRAANTPPGAPPPAFTTFDRQQFHVTALDARYSTGWGKGHLLTVGTTLYTSDSPRYQRRSTNLLGEMESGETWRFAQQRDNRYAAVFVENAFRVGDWTLVPGLRQESLSMGIEEPLRLASLRRAAIDRDFDRSETLLGFGATRLLDENWRFYANASQGYRPMRYDDIGNPTAEFAGSNDPDPARSMQYEIGVRGNAAPGLMVEASLFRIDFEDKIEQRLVNVTDIERVNSGDARHQGIEFSIDWNLLAGRPGDDALVLFTNASLMDAEIVRSGNPALVGRTPQFAPEKVLRAGLLWKGADGSRVALTGIHLSDQFWQDSNLPLGTGAATIPARIAPVTVWDLGIEWPLLEDVRLVAGINNLTDKIYYNRVRTDGIDVAPRRSTHLGVSLRF